MTQTQNHDPVRVATVEDLQALAGTEVGVSSWREVTQQDVNAFAHVTGDDQWIHTDPERAGATEFRGTIAHGYFTLALAPVLLAEILPLDGFAMAVNYGLDRVRFPAPMPVGDRLRMRLTLTGLEEFPGGGTLSVQLSFESESGDKPVCVANALYRVFEVTA